MDGQLPWRLPDDLKRFKALTLGHTVLMGRKTFDSIGRPLPGRRNWVLSRDTSWSRPGVVRLDSLEAAVEQHTEGLLWVIGGGQIYQAALPLVSRVEATEIDTTLDAADAWFPRLDPDHWHVVSREHHPRDDRHEYAFDFVRWSSH
ncbi:MAG: dihydrofolate reductase [Xanthomonadales bacterium]|nr:dihydrofolate reductase [Xanthomonadales bacterium]